MRGSVSKFLGGTLKKWSWVSDISVRQSALLSLCICDVLWWFAFPYKVFCMIVEHDSMLLSGHAWRLWRARIYQGTTSKPFNSAFITRDLLVFRKFAFLEKLKRVSTDLIKSSIVIFPCIIDKLLHHFAACSLCAVLCPHRASLDPGEASISKLHLCLTATPSGKEALLFKRWEPRPRPIC